jgi:hypothetical protein
MPPARRGNPGNFTRLEEIPVKTPCEISTTAEKLMHTAAHEHVLEFIGIALP